VVAVAVVAEAGTVTAAIAAVVAAGTAAGKRLQQFEFVIEPGSIEAPRFYFLGCQGAYFGLCFP